MSTQPQKPPLEPILIPDSPEPKAIPEQEKEETSAPRVVPIRAGLELTLEDVGLIAKADAEEAIRCVAVLLHWASRDGRDAVPGVLATGLAEALFLCADRLKGNHE